MVFLIFILSLILYAFIALKVKQWEVITGLGLPTETPRYYLQHPGIYGLIKTVCLVGALISVLLSPYRYSGAVGIPIIGLLWFVVNNAGINGGIKEYRRVMKETCEYYDSNPSEGEDDFYKTAKQSLTLTDNQIYEVYKRNQDSLNLLKKYNIG